MFNEIDALNTLKRKFKSRSEDIFLGIGDDCAAIKTGINKLMLISTDSLIEEIHFSRSYFKPLEIANKSIAVSISDIASMGGKPRFILSTIGLPKCSKQELMDELLDGIKSSCALYGVELIGGNITTSEKLFLDTTVLGEIDEHMVVKRSGSKPGDLVFVTGTLGDSALGLMLLKSEHHSDLDHDPRSCGDKDLINSHKVPKARVEIGISLSEKNLASSMIDISDGFLIDLERITTEQNLGAKIFVGNIPLSDSYKNLISNFDDDIFKLALTGGEDYELLFTSPPESRDKLKTMEKLMKFSISEIGVITGEKKIELIDNEGNNLNYKNRGYVHLS
ncbi:MAG: thiamine-phosphate kinase [Thermodesulfobacteriota bacterium]